MRCIGVSCVRNEADIVELWARHNLNLVDELHVVDHGSIDRTRWILERLREEGLPLVLYRDEDPAHRQEQVLSRLARTLAARGRAEKFIPLDADEFLALPSRQALHAALATLPAGHAGAMYWQTFLPEPTAGPADTAIPFFRRMRRYRRHELRNMAKVVLQAADCAACAWIPGQHAAVDSAGRAIPTTVLPFRLAHYPVRDADQLARKVVTGFVARQLKPERMPDEGWHWAHILGLLRDSGWRPEKLDLERIALTYSFPDTPDVQEVLTDQALLIFDDVVQRYPAAALPWKTALAEASRQLAAAGHSSLDGTGTG
jgi:hypothetical protein